MPLYKDVVPKCVGESITSSRCLNLASVSPDSLQLVFVTYHIVDSHCWKWSNAYTLPVWTAHSHLHKNYLLFPVMKALLRLHRINYSVQDSGRVDHDLSLQVGQILELAAGSELENVRERNGRRVYTIVYAAVNLQIVSRLSMTQVFQHYAHQMLIGKFKFHKLLCIVWSRCEKKIGICPNKSLDMVHYFVCTFLIILPLECFSISQMIIPSEASSNHPGPGLQMIHGTIHLATPTSSSSSSFANTTGTTGAPIEAVAGRRGEGEEDDISLGLPSLGVTPADLASALASIGTENSNSQPTSMRYV